ILFASLIPLALLLMADPASATIPVARSALGAGYLAEPAAGVVSVKTQFVVPSVTCKTDGDFEAIFLGVFGYNGSHASTNYAEVFAACNHSLSPTFFANAGTGGGGFHQLSVAIGDTILTRIDETSTTTKVTIKNITAGTSTTTIEDRVRDASVLVG